jgi:hypothetical protein
MSTLLATRASRMWILLLLAILMGVSGREGEVLDP